jgi:hypothetical protein
MQLLSAMQVAAPLRIDDAAGGAVRECTVS